MENKLETFYTVSKNGWQKLARWFEWYWRRATKCRRRRSSQTKKSQRYIEYSLKRLQPRYLQRKAQENLMENLIATCNDFSTRTIQRDVSFQISSYFLNDEEETKTRMATLGQEMENLWSELQDHRVNAVEGICRTIDSNQKGRQNAERFCKYCRTNGQTSSWCRKKIRDEELKRIEDGRTAEEKVKFNQGYNKNKDQTMDQINALAAKTSKGETRNTLTMDSREIPPQLIRISLPDQTSHMKMERTIRIRGDNMIDAQINCSMEVMEKDLKMDISEIRVGAGETKEKFLVLHCLKGRTSH